MTAPSPSPAQNPRNSFPAWRLPKGTINAADGQLDEASSSCERWQWGCAGLVVAAVLAELAIAGIHPPYDSLLNKLGTTLADAAIALGIVGEVLFGRMDARIQTELRNRSNKRLAFVTQSAAEANVRAATADLARAELEAQFKPRMLNQRQWDLIQSLKGKLSAVNIAFETDARVMVVRDRTEKSVHGSGDRRRDVAAQPERP